MIIAQQIPDTWEWPILQQFIIYWLRLATVHNCSQYRNIREGVAWQWFSVLSDSQILSSIDKNTSVTATSSSSTSRHNLAMTQLWYCCVLDVIIFCPIKAKIWHNYVGEQKIQVWCKFRVWIRGKYVQIWLVIERSWDIVPWTFWQSLATSSWMVQHMWTAFPMPQVFPQYVSLNMGV